MEPFATSSVGPAYEGPLFVSLVRDLSDMTDLAVYVPDDGLFRIAGMEPEIPVGRNEDDSGGTTVIGSSKAVAIETTKVAGWSGSVDSEIRVDRAGVSVSNRAAGEFYRWMADTGGSLKGFAPLVSLGASEEILKSDPFLARALAVLERSGIESMEKSAALVGLGIGFTPSGDDFLAGLFLAHAAAGREPPEALRCAVLKALKRTTTGGATLLYLVLNDRFPAYQLRFLEDLRRGRPIKEIVDRLRNHGETSGTDMAAGFCWAWATLLSDESISPAGGE